VAPGYLAEKCGRGVTSRPRPGIDGEVKPDRHMEVKDRSKGQTTIRVSRNEIIYALNQADKFILSIVIVDGNTFEVPFYIKNPFRTEPEFGIDGVNYDLSVPFLKYFLPTNS